MTTKLIDSLQNIYKAHYGVIPKHIEKLPLSGSERIYFRMWYNKQSVIGVFNSDIKENEAFFSFTNTFKKLNISVPEIFHISDNKQFYLISDLGNTTLYKHISENNDNTVSDSGTNETLCYLKQALLGLLKIQIEGAKHIDFSKCYPRKAFDKQSIAWDLNYFKYLFLKPTGTAFDEQLLENDFKNLTEYLLKVPSEYFMFRDFQSRNIMIFEKQTWFIDYQGGRRGPLQYDLASLLYSPKTQLNPIQRKVFLMYYIEELKKHIDLDEVEFVKSYYAFVLVRILQALGAYGFRGLIEHKPGFIDNIPLAISNLSFLFENKLIPLNVPEIEKLSKHLTQSELSQIPDSDNGKLTIHINSFSYKKGIPHDTHDNGGGYVFDCRGLPNPGRLNEYKAFNGTQEIIINYLEEHEQVLEFQKLVRQMVSISIKEYMARNFSNLCVNFGCTGGQHRSVYNAQKFSQWVENNFDVNVVLKHIELEKKENEQNAV